MVFQWNQRQKKVSYVFPMTNSCEPNDATLTPSIGMEILHFPFFPYKSKLPEGFTYLIQSYGLMLGHSQPRKLARWFQCP